MRTKVLRETDNRDMASVEEALRAEVRAVREENHRLRSSSNKSEILLSDRNLQIRVAGEVVCVINTTTKHIVRLTPDAEIGFRIRVRGLELEGTDRQEGDGGDD